jgi:transcriptional regulator with XRE-family HTH domain
MFITLEQIRAARALLRWTQKDLAAHAGVNDDQVHNFEGGRSRSLEVLEAIYQAFVTNGIEFTDGEGVRKKTNQVYTLKGRDNFLRFFDGMYEEVKQVKELYACNVDEELFDKWLGETSEEHTRRMEEIDGLVCLTLVEEGKDYFPCESYTEYKWVKKAHFEPSPFYVFGDKVAILLFEDDDVSMIVIHHPDVARAYKKQFLLAWETALVPEKKYA